MNNKNGGFIGLRYTNLSRLPDARADYRAINHDVSAVPRGFEF